jgi:Permuted papain-like amidase enzyme, YaeF/YiiX, C92 family
MQPLTESWYIFDLSLVQAGDILLSTVPTSVLSFFIRSLTPAAPFSHAAIAIDQRLLVEARGFGVARVGVARLAVRSRSNIQVLRLRQESLAPDVAAAGGKAAEWADSKVGMPYSLRGALLAVLEKVPVSERHAFFCSHLVAAAYHSVGIELLPSLPPEKTLPGHFAGSQFLVDVTEKVTHEEMVDSASVRRAIEEGPSWSPHQEEVQKYQELIDGVRPTFTALGLLPPSEFGALLIALKHAPAEAAKVLDKGCVDVFEAIRFADLLDLARDAFYWASYYDDVIRQGLEIGTLSRADVVARLPEWGARLEGLERDCQRDTLGLDALHEAFRSTQLETFRLLLPVFQTAAYRRSQNAAALRRTIALVEGLESRSGA